MHFVKHVSKLCWFGTIFQTNVVCGGFVRNNSFRQGSGRSLVYGLENQLSQPNQPTRSAKSLCLSIPAHSPFLWHSLSASVPYMAVVNCTLPAKLMLLWAAPLTLSNQQTYWQLLVLAWFRSPNVFGQFGDLLQQPSYIGSAIRNYWKQTGGGWFPPYWLPIVFGFSLLKNTTSYHFHCIKVLFIKHFFFTAWNPLILIISLWIVKSIQRMVHSRVSKTLFQKSLWIFFFRILKWNRLKSWEM